MADRKAVTRELVGPDLGGKALGQSGDGHGDNAAHLGMNARALLSLETLCLHPRDDVEDSEDAQVGDPSISSDPVKSLGKRPTVILKGDPQ